METTEIWKNVSIEDIPGEEWRDVVGYEGKYQVSNMGRIKSINYKRTGKEGIREQREVKGYLQVTLFKNGKGDYQYVHRLVAIAFIPNPYNLPEINHKDENTKNNCVENIEWISHQDNVDYSLSKSVMCVETGIVYISACEAARQIGADDGNIIRCCKGKRKTAGGYHWQYADLLPQDSDGNP